MKRKAILLPILVILFLWSCNDDDKGSVIIEDPSSIAEVGSIDLGETGASEITAYDPETKRLFVVNNSAGASKVDVVDLTNPAAPAKINSIDISSYGGGVNSVAVKNGLVAAAIEGFTKTDNGKIVVFTTNTYEKVAEVTAGALPDMVTFSPDGNYIVSANEGEPNSDYTVDPVGSVSIISVKENYAVSTVDFSGSNGAQATLAASGYRVFGPGANLAKDTEPEYVAISSDSKTAFVTLQENNAIAKVDLKTKQIQNIYPLGFKDLSIATNGIDPSDKDSKVEFRTAPIKGMYLPDAIAAFSVGGKEYVITVNEGDTREYDGFVEEKRIKDLTLDASVFPDASNLKKDVNFGRLKVTSTLGKNGDSYNALYSFGTRSFSIWNTDGTQVFDSGNDLEKRTIDAGKYDDDRSDDKGIEPEGVAIGKLGHKTIAFVGLERADAVLLYDVSDAASPKFIKLLETGDAPEGILFVPAADAPNRKSLLIVSSEGDGLIKIFEAQ